MILVYQAQIMQVLWDFPRFTLEKLSKYLYSASVKDFNN